MPGGNTGQYETGRYETGEYRRPDSDAGQYQRPDDTGQYQRPDSDTGQYETGQFETGQYQRPDADRAAYADESQGTGQFPVQRSQDSGAPSADVLGDADAGPGDGRTPIFDTIESNWFNHPAAAAAGVPPQGDAEPEVLAAAAPRGSTGRPAARRGAQRRARRGTGQRCAPCGAGRGHGPVAQLAERRDVAAGGADPPARRGRCHHLRTAPPGPAREPCRGHRATAAVHPERSPGLACAQ